MQLKYLALIFPLSLAGAPAIDHSFTIDLSPLSYPLITADSQSNIVIAGFVRSCALPVVQPISSCGPLWIAKFDSTGQTLLFATYLGDHVTPSGGFASTAGFGLQTDSNGNIVMVCSVANAILPTVNPIQSAVNGRSSLYIFKLASDGSRLIYATYLGGDNYEVPVSLAVDGSGAAYILDTTNSSDFPATPQAVNSTVYGRSAIVKLTADGALEYAASFPWVYSIQPITVDASGAVTLIAAPTNILKLSPDAASLTTAPIPTWANAEYSSNYPFVSATSDGGLWITGSIDNGNLPVTPNALESVTGASPYMRIENGSASAPFRIPAHAIADFVVDPADGTRIYAATDAGLFASSDNGMTWTLLFSIGTQAVAVDPFDSNILYLGAVLSRGSDPGLYRSADRGQTWTPVMSPLLANSAIVSISADPNVPGLVYAAGRGFYRSRDSGETWTDAALPPSLGNGNSPSSTYYFLPKSVRADPTHPNQVFVAGVDQCLGFCPVFPDVIQSTDAGATISKLPLNYSSSGAVSLSIDPTTGDLYFLDGGKVTAFRPSNAYANEPLATDVAAIAFDPASPGIFYEALSDGSILQTQNAGATWSPVVQLPSTANVLAVSAGGVLHASQSAATIDAFVLRYDTAGNIRYGSYLSGGATTEKTSAVTALDHLLIAGTTGPDLPLLDAVQSSFGGATDGFLAEFDSDGTLLNSTYLGGTGKDEVDAIIPLPDGSVVVIGTTDSTDFAGTVPPSAIGAGKTFVVHVVL